MNEAWNFDRCVSVLTEEVGLLKKISAMQGKTRQAVMSREWDDFDEKTQEANELSEEFTRLENERLQLFSALTNASITGASSEGEASVLDNGSAVSWAMEEKTFYAMIMTLPEEERRQLSELYRELKMETLKMKAHNETFLAYLAEVKTMTAAYIEAVCPDRGGKLYTRKGHRVSQDLKSIVFNNRF